MIKATKILTNYIEAQDSLTLFCKKARLARGSVYALLRGKTPSSETVQKILNITGLDYEKAFESK